MKQYYTAKDYFRKRFDVLSRQMAYRAETPEAHRIWKSELRSVLKSLIGIPTMQTCELRATAAPDAVFGDYRRDRVVIQTEPGVFMPVYVLLPGGLKEGEKRPAVIAAHGHAGGGKLATAGVRDVREVAEAIDTYNYGYGVDLVRRGFIVFCPEARGFGERREGVSQGDTGESMLNSSCFQLNNMAVPLGQTVTGMWVWDLMRLIDYIQGRPDCYSNRIGCAGLSGGGLQTLWLASLDDRIHCAVISGYFYGYKQSLLEMPNGCSCNYIPHLWEKADMGDIGALIAPRPLLIETGTQDDLNGEGGIENVVSQVEITKRAYALLGEEDRLYHHVFDTGHRWNGEKAVEWLLRWI